MIEFYEDITSKPCLLVLGQIKVGQEISGTSKPLLEKIAKNLKECGFNLSFPMACLTEEEDKYHLLTGLPIYEAAIMAELDRIWVFLIAAKQPEAEKAVEQLLLQSKLNDRIVESQDITEFLEFINHQNSDLKSIPGVKDGYAKIIAANRPYISKEDMQKKLGAKRSLNWLKAYKAR